MEKKLKILFLTLIEIDHLDQGGIYPDLLKCLVQFGHHLTIVCPVERKNKVNDITVIDDNYSIYRVKTLNIQKTNIIEKALGVISIDYLFAKKLKTIPNIEDIDILLYSTPPITLVNSITFLKKRVNPFTYLLLKDIFPQNAVDLEYFSKNSLIYKYFRRKEKNLYRLSDFIGCMSNANVKYLLENNPNLDPKKVEVCPNSIINQNQIISQERKLEIRKELGLPTNKTIFIYGGNLGKPQAVDEILKFLNSQINNDKVYYIIAGSGTEYDKIKVWMDITKPKNIELHPNLPHKIYDLKIKCADVGLVFLDRRFTIPNFPSRILPYLDNGLPTVAAIDKGTDLGIELEKYQIGKWSLIGEIEELEKNISYFCDLSNESKITYSHNCKNYLIERASAHKSAKSILKAYNNCRNESSSI